MHGRTWVPFLPSPPRHSRVRSTDSGAVPTVRFQRASAQGGDIGSIDGGLRSWIPVLSSAERGDIGAVMRVPEDPQVLAERGGGMVIFCGEHSSPEQ